MRHSCGQFGRWVGRRGRTWALLQAILLGSAAALASPRSVTTTHLRIVYEVNATAWPLESVALWYTTDLGQTWQLYGYDEDLRSPALFEARGEGLYGFFAVVRNRVGESSADPCPETQPLQQVLVDLSSPLLQAHSATLTRSDGKEVVSIRWTAYDAHFGARPITLEYRPAREPGWHTIARDLPNEERYEWELPREVLGQTIIRLSARDTAGNVTTATFSPVDIELAEEATPEPGAAKTAGQAESPQGAPARPAGTEAPLLPPDRGQRIEALLAQAQWHTERGEWALARQRLSELLTLAPENAQALKALADVDYRTGDYANALRAYRDVLRLRPEDIAAWRGRALTEVAVRDYAGAAVSLERVLEFKPQDAETQLYLGDVLLMMGRRQQAREVWKRAGEATSPEQDVAAKVARRLQIYRPETQ